MNRLTVVVSVAFAVIAAPCAEAQRSGQNASISVGTVVKVEDIDLRSQNAPAGALVGADRFVGKDSILSGPAGGHNYQRLRSLYFEGARLIPIGNRFHATGKVHAMSVDEWIDDISAYFEEHPFYIREIQRHADRFGDDEGRALFSGYGQRRRVHGAGGHHAADPAGLRRRLPVAGADRAEPE